MQNNILMPVLKDWLKVALYATDCSTRKEMWFHITFHLLDKRFSSIPLILESAKNVEIEHDLNWK